MAENNSSAPLKTAKGAPVDQWQKRHPNEEGGAWQNTNRGDAMWWRDNSQGWEIRALYEAAPQAVEAQAPTAVAYGDGFMEAINEMDGLYETEPLSIPARPATEDSSAGDLAESTQDDEGISRGDWLAQAERLYLAVGDTLDEARMCASYLYNEQDWDGFGGDDPIHAALDDVEGRGPKAEVQAEPVAWASPETLAALEMHRDVNQFPAGGTVLAVKAGGATEPLYTAPQAQPADAPIAYLQEADQHLLHRFIETTEDDESFDIGKDAVKRLANLGVVESCGFGRYGVTMFGYWVHEHFWHQNPSLPLKTNADRDREHRAAMAAAQEGGNAAKEA